MSKTINFLKEHESKVPSKFQEKAEWRHENREWLRWSRYVALSLVEYMETNGINRNGRQNVLKLRLNMLVKYYQAKSIFRLKV